MRSIGLSVRQSYEQIEGKKWVFWTLRYSPTFKLSSSSTSTQRTSQRVYLTYVVYSPGIWCSRKCLYDKLILHQTGLKTIFVKKTKEVIIKNIQIWDNFCKLYIWPTALNITDVFTLIPHMMTTAAPCLSSTSQYCWFVWKIQHVGRSVQWWCSCNLFSNMCWRPLTKQQLRRSIVNESTWTQCRAATWIRRARTDCAFSRRVRRDVILAGDEVDALSSIPASDLIGACTCSDAAVVSRYWGVRYHIKLCRR